MNVEQTSVLTLKPTQFLIVGSKNHISELSGILSYYQGTENLVKTFDVDEEGEIRVLKLTYALALSDSIIQHAMNVFKATGKTIYNLRSNSLNINLDELNFQTYISFFGLKDAISYYETELPTPNTLFETLKSLIGYFSFLDIQKVIMDFIGDIETNPLSNSWLKDKIDEKIKEGLGLDDASRLWNHLLILYAGYNENADFKSVTKSWLRYQEAEKEWTNAMKIHLK